MNITALKQSLVEHEGSSDLPYNDSEGNLTVGIGHNLDSPMPEDLKQLILDHDISVCISELDRLFDSWRDHDDLRQNVLLEMCFNMGGPSLSGFKKMWAALKVRDYSLAAKEMLLSRWAVQVGKRAKILSDRMRDGE